jgi:hypothetical protein
MSFFRTAKVNSLGVFDLTSGGNARTAFRKTGSYFLQNAGKIDLESALKDVADIYAISDRVGDYIFLPARASSVDVPNENGDCFTDAEMRRFNPALARKSYQTYLMKPHHINHRADNPRMSRGFVVDVHYNDQNPMPEKWRAYYKKSTGVDHTKDVFIEALIAVDTKKDPYLAEGYRTDAIRTFSMGCNCDRTRCHVCGNIAHDKREFCEHIARGKRKFFPSKLFGGLSVMAYEECEDVVFDELSAVDEPADPRAEKGGPAFGLQASRQTVDVLAYLRSNPDNIPHATRTELLRMALRMKS